MTTKSLHCQTHLLSVQRDILLSWTARPSGISAGFAACLHSSESDGTWALYRTGTISIIILDGEYLLLKLTHNTSICNSQKRCEHLYSDLKLSDWFALLSVLLVSEPVEDVWGPGTRCWKSLHCTALLPDVKKNITSGNWATCEHN